MQWLVGGVPLEQLRRTVDQVHVSHHVRDNKRDKFKLFQAFSSSLELFRALLSQISRTHAKTHEIQMSETKS